MRISIAQTTTDSRQSVSGLEDATQFLVNDDGRCEPNAWDLLLATRFFILNVLANR